MEGGISVKLERVGEEVEYIRNPVPGKIYMADPRQFNLSEFNPRVIVPNREMEKLEDSILKVGFRFPVISDMDYNIVAGGRRWRIALKYGLKLPVIFVEYESDIQKILDGFLENNPTPLATGESKRTINLLQSKGFSEREIASMIALSEENMKVILRGEIQDTTRLPTLEGVRVERRLKAARSFVQNLLSSKRLSPEQVSQILVKVSELPREEIKQLEKEAREDLPVDVERRIKEVEKVSISFFLPKEEYSSLLRKVKNRNWDLQMTLIALVRKFVSGVFELEQEDYEAVLK